MFYLLCVSFCAFPFVFFLSCFYFSNFFSLLYNLSSSSFPSSLFFVLSLFFTPGFFHLYPFILSLSHFPFSSSVPSHRFTFPFILFLSPSPFSFSFPFLLSLSHLPFLLPISPFLFSYSFFLSRSSFPFSFSFLLTYPYFIFSFFNLSFNSLFLSSNRIYLCLRNLLSTYAPF